METQANEIRRFGDGFSSGGFKTGVPAKLDKKKPYLVYCRTGRRCGAAITVTQEMGFTNIIRMNGGILKRQSDNPHLVK